MQKTYSIQHWVIVLFCLWHCAAIALYLLPKIQVPVIGPVISEVKAIAKPYVLLLSQWQWWNIFSPDPLRRSSTYRIDINEHGKWRPVTRIDYDSLRGTERAKEIKILERLEEDWKTLVPFYLQPMCKRMPQSEGRTIRLVAVSVMLPSHLSQLQRLSTSNLPKTETTLGSTLCTHP